VAQLDSFRLDGRVALIAGGGGAIGSALGTALAGVGAKVVLMGLKTDPTAEVSQRIKDAGGDALPVVADATSEQECEAAVAQALEHYGRLDIVVNAVGGGAGKVLFSAEEYPRDAWDWIMELNLRSTLVATQAAVKPIIAAGRGGKVLNLVSVRAFLGINSGYSAYVAAKGAIAALTRQWATEWAKYKINVNGISPTFVDTPQVATLLADPDFKAGVVNRIPLGRVGTTDDLVGAAIFLCSDASNFITGQILGIDGGLTATQ
jgi:gluconate 5-dehydrogenase